MASDGDSETRVVTAATGKAWWRSLPWLLLGLTAAAVLALRLQLGFDLSAFFPQKTNLMHDVLLEQFRNGPGSRLLVVGINGLSREHLGELSDDMRETLQGDAAFVSVLNGALPDELQAPPEPIASYYLLMRDVDYGADSLHRAVQERLRDLAFGGGSMLAAIARDPLLVTLDIVESLTPVDLSGDLWFAENGSAVLIAETVATPVDLAAQAAAITIIREAFSQLPGSANASLEITGVGAFSVALQETIRAEAVKRSVLASIAVLLILLLFYRRPGYLLLSALPIGMGFLLGLAVVTLIFETVHGVTLAFGFTLMGVAIDYPLHLFSHSRRSAPQAAIAGIWPTIRLGAASTAIAYLALALSGSSGLAQLGVFTATGILVAVLVTRTWLPWLLPRPDQAPDEAGAKQVTTLRFLPALSLIVVAAVLGSWWLQDDVWDDKLTSLTPVPAERIRLDAGMRSATGALDMRYQIVIHDENLESLLQRNEMLDSHLGGANAAGILSGWQSVTQLLPSERTQERRRLAVPDTDTLQRRLAEATGGTPFRESAFDSFVKNAERTRELETLAVTDMRQSALASWLNAHLIVIGDQWVSLVSLTAPNAEALSAMVESWDADANWMDFQQTSVDLMRDYRHGVQKTVAIAAGLILLLLWYQRRRIAEIAWIGITVATSLALTIAIVLSVHGPLTVIHLVALLLVLGLGLDYSLFLSRRESAEERTATNHAVLACVASTGIAFAVLAGSSIPVLRFIGLTVATGSVVSYLLAVLGSRLPARGIR